MDNPFKLDRICSWSCGWRSRTVLESRCSWILVDLQNLLSQFWVNAPLFLPQAAEISPEITRECRSWNSWLKTSAWFVLCSQADFFFSPDCKFPSEDSVRRDLRLSPANRESRFLNSPSFRLLFPLFVVLMFFSLRNLFSWVKPRPPHHPHPPGSQVGVTPDYVQLFGCFLLHLADVETLNLKLDWSVLGQQLYWRRRIAFLKHSFFFFLLRHSSEGSCTNF